MRSDTKERCHAVSSHAGSVHRCKLSATTVGTLHGHDDSEGRYRYGSAPVCTRHDRAYPYAVLWASDWSEVREREPVVLR